MGILSIGIFSELSMFVLHVMLFTLFPLIVLSLFAVVVFFGIVRLRRHKFSWVKFFSSRHRLALLYPNGIQNFLAFQFRFFKLLSSENRHSLVVHRLWSVELVLLINLDNWLLIILFHSLEIGNFLNGIHNPLMVSPGRFLSTDRDEDNNS